MARLDLHAHLAPCLAIDASLAGVARADDGRLVLDGAVAGPPALYDPARLLAWMDAAGLDAALVSMPPPFYRQQLPEREAADWARRANDGLLAAAAVDPRRLLPAAYLPLEHPAVALREHERVRGLGFAAVTACAGGASRSLADPALEPLWEALERDGRLLSLHPGASADARMGPLYLANLLGNPLETTLAAAQLLLGDVLGRHPRLRVLLVHAGGAVPALLGRWERGVATDRPGLGPLTRPLRDALRGLHADCLAHDPGALELAIGAFGEDRIVLGSDWPFPMGSEDPLGLVARCRDAAFAQRVADANAHAALGS